MMLHYRSLTIAIAAAALVTMTASLVCYGDIKVGTHTWAPRDDAEYRGGYSHLDLAWEWTIEQGQQMIQNDWTSICTQLDDNPTYYSGECGMMYAPYSIMKLNPSLWAQVKAHADRRHLDMTAGGWVEGYYPFGGDEMYLRNFYISNRFCQDNFGYPSLVAAQFDCTEEAWTQPKIQSYVTGRSAENPTGVTFYNIQDDNSFMPFGSQGARTTYRWTSDDGSMTIVGNGGGAASGDGGGGAISGPGAGIFPDFARKVYAENQWNTAVPNLWNDHLITQGSGYSLVFWGFKMCENRLLEAEKFATFARPYGYRYPLTGDWYNYEIWGNVLRHSMHDMGDAQGTPWQTAVSNTTNANAQDDFQTALKVADTTLRGALAVISSHVNTSGSGTSVIVYNALSWARTDYVMVKTSDIGFSTPISVKDEAGAVILSQVIMDSGVTKLVFTAENVPSLGFKEFKVSNAAATATPGASATGGAVITMNNDFLTVKIDKATGAITSANDKVNSKELLSGPGNRIASTTASPNWWDDCCQFYSHFPNPMPATLTYKTPTAVTLVDSGPAIARVKVTYTENGVNWDHFISLYSKVPVVVNKMVTSNLVADNELVLNLPLATTVSNSTKEINVGVAYGHHKYINQNRYETGHKWSNVSSDAKDYGVSLLENNCTLYHFYGVGGAHDLRLVLIAEQTSRWAGHWSKNNWEMSWGIWGHAGDWTDGAVQKGYEFNSPLISRVEVTHGGSLPKSFSFLSVDQENIVVTAVKKWESESPVRTDSLTMQVRFYEIDGKNTDASLNFPGSPTINAWESMGSEYGVYGNKLPVANAGGMQKVTLTTGHNQIRSLKVQTTFSPVGSSRNSIPAMPIGGMAAGASSLIYNARGQMVSREIAPGSRRDSISKALPSSGVYLMRYVDPSGRSIATRRVFSPGMVNR